MLRFFTWLGSLILILLATIIALPFLVPLDSYRDDVLRFVEQKTGREVTINGPLELKLLPEVKLQLNDVTVKNPEGFISPHLAKIGTLDLNIALWPLFEKKVEVHELTINEGDFYLEEAIGGKKNWEFTVMEMTKTAAGASQSNAPQFALNVDAINVVNTRISYLKPGQKFTSEKLNLDYSNNRSKLNVLLNFAGANYQIDVQTDNTMSLFSDAATPLSGSVKSSLVKANLNGVLNGLNVSSGVFDPSVAGELQATITGIGQVNSRKFSANQKQANLEMLTITTQKDISASGSLKVDYSGSKPLVNTTLTIPSLNLDALTGGNKSASNFVLPLVSNAYADEGWSRAPIDFSALNMLNADANVTVNDLITSGYVFSNFKTTLALRNGNLTIPNFSTGLLGGNLAGSGAADSRGTWNLRAKITDMPFQNLAKQFTDKVAVTGNTNLNISLKSNGNSVYDYVNRLSGGGDMIINNGVVSGYSLPTLFAKTGTALGVVESNDGVKTPFDNITLDFSMDGGVMRLREGSLRAPSLKAGTTGTINLGAKSLDLVLTPQTIPNAVIQEDGTSKQYAGLMVPIIIKGPFSNVTLKPDYTRTLGNLLNEALKNPQDLEGLKMQGKAIEDAFEPSKDIIKEQFKDFKENKNPAALKGMLQELDKNGLNPFGDAINAIPDIELQKPKSPAPATANEPISPTVAPEPAADAPAAKVEPDPIAAPVAAKPEPVVTTPPAAAEPVPAPAELPDANQAPATLETNG